MEHAPSPFEDVALGRAVPRYTSYPTAPHFEDRFAPADYARWLSELAQGTPVSLYLHVPFCDDLCWFCACRTQGSRRYAPVARYLDLLEAEIAMVAGHMDTDRPVSQVHWGGGSPTILRPDAMLHLHETVARHFPQIAGAEFAAEIDPRDITPQRLAALAAAGLTRASIGVQDFDPQVQHAIGRHQGHAMTRDVILGLRAYGIDSINIDFLYGLPHQTRDSLARTIEQVLALAPDRLALFGYAHVPWMAKRQKMIDATALPDPAERKAQAELAREMLVAAGYEAVGIDHFARPGDALAEAARKGTLRRNFQGYTVDRAEALIGFGASAIGSLPQGYVQNDPVTASYQVRVEAGQLPVRKGLALNLTDKVRRAAIEQILCGFCLDIDRLERVYGDFARQLRPVVARLMRLAPEGALMSWHGGFRLSERWTSHARLVAAEFDTYLDQAGARHSLAV